MCMENVFPSTLPQRNGVALSGVKLGRHGRSNWTDWTVSVLGTVSCGSYACCFVGKDMGHAL